MRAYIHALNGEPWNEECVTAQKGFMELGIECVLFSNSESLKECKRSDVVVGGMYITEHALAARGVVPPVIDYPDSLKRFLGRKVWMSTVEDLHECTLPVFVKPADEKELPGVVAQDGHDLVDYFAHGDDYPVLCSEPVGFVSEMRLFIRYGRLVDARRYRGDSTVRYDSCVVRDVVASYVDAPAGCSIDLGVTADGRTLLIEVNDGYALGCYGADPVAYALLLSARWAELMGVKDELAHVNPFEPQIN